MTMMLNVIIYQEVLNVSVVKDLVVTDSDVMVSLLSVISLFSIKYFIKYINSSMNCIQGINNSFVKILLIIKKRSDSIVWYTKQK